MPHDPKMPLDEYLLLFLLSFGEEGFDSLSDGANIPYALNTVNNYRWSDLIELGYLREAYDQHGPTYIKLTTKALELIRSKTDG